MSLQYPTLGRKNISTRGPLNCRSLRYAALRSGMTIRPLRRARRILIEKQLLKGRTAPK